MCRFLVALFLPAALATSATVTETPGVQCVDENSADHLTQAVDAAIMELQSTIGWFHNLRTSTNSTNYMSVGSCTPDDSKWTYPSADSATGILARVLTLGKLRVAGVQWGPYNAPNPVGFWPNYMQEITDKLATAYGIPIELERVYYANSGLVVDAVADGSDVDMSEPYYYLAGFHLNAPRIEALAFSCITAGTASKFYTKADSGITTTEQLYNAILSGPSRQVGFIGKGNYDSVSSILPDNVIDTIVDEGDAAIAAMVANGALLAGYVSEGAPPDAAQFNVFETGIVSPRTILFHKDHYVCSLATSQSPGSPPPPPSPPPLPGSPDSLPADASAECDDIKEEKDVLLVVLVVIAAVALVLVLLLSFVIMRERQSKPLFMPLLKEVHTTKSSTTQDRL